MAIKVYGFGECTPCSPTICILLAPLALPCRLSPPSIFSPQSSSLPLSLSLPGQFCRINERADVLDIVSKTEGNPRTLACRSVAAHSGVEVEYVETPATQKELLSKDFVSKFPLTLVSSVPLTFILCFKRAQG